MAVYIFEENDIPYLDNSICFNVVKLENVFQIIESYQYALTAMEVPFHLMGLLKNMGISYASLSANMANVRFSAVKCLIRGIILKALRRGSVG